MSVFSAAAPNTEKTVSTPFGPLDVEDIQTIVAALGISLVVRTGLLTPSDHTRIHSLCRLQIRALTFSISSVFALTATRTSLYCRSASLWPSRDSFLRSLCILHMISATASLPRRCFFASGSPTIMAACRTVHTLCRFL